MGRPWYDAGKVLTKRNTFTDFIACAQHLVDEVRLPPSHTIRLSNHVRGPAAYQRLFGKEARFLLQSM